MRNIRGAEPYVAAKGKKFCTRCGKELDIFDLQEDFAIHKTVGYGSVYDGVRVNIRFCCDCFDEIVGQCKMPIKDEEDLCEQE